MVKVISFDFDGTIASHKFADKFWLEGVPRLYAKQNDMSLKSAKKYLFEEYDKIGDSRIEWYDPAYWFNRFKIDSDWNDLLKYYQQSVEIYPDVAPVLQRLSQHYSLIISSNAKREFIDIQLDASQLRHYFTNIFSSTSDFHTVKKVTDFYGMICKKLSVQPQDMVHIGDHKEFDYLSPQKLGITAFYLDRTKTSTGPDIVHDFAQFEEILLKN
ncbi:MAG TPA: HAD family hydrolase [Thermoplasmata archaeon]|jgi:5'-nucleotidase|nr:MAG TPA: HAD family hydrolase [Thermoplasmata archaeon]